MSPHKADSRKGWPGFLTLEQIRKLIDAAAPALAADLAAIADTGARIDGELAGAEGELIEILDFLREARSVAPGAAAALLAAESAVLRAKHRLHQAIEHLDSMPNKLGVTLVGDVEARASRVLPSNTLCGPSVCPDGYREVGAFDIGGGKEWKVFSPCRP
jgi:hypothetical protein